MCMCGVGAPEGVFAPGAKQARTATSINDHSDSYFELSHLSIAGQAIDLASLIHLAVCNVWV